MKKMSRRDDLEKLAVAKIEPESDDGNKEYKLKLDNSNPLRIEQMISQMRFRVDEGFGEALYTLGVSDSGGVIGLTLKQYEQSKEILDTVAQKGNYTVTLLSEQKVDIDKKMYEFLIREN